MTEGPPEARPAESPLGPTDSAGRVIVTGPRTGATRGLAGGGLRDLDEQTAVGAVYLRSLVRAQLRLAVVVCGTVGAVIAVLPLLFLQIPELRTMRVAGLALPWLILGVVAYPAMVAGGWVYTWYAERNERRFAELVGPR